MKQLFYTTQPQNKYLYNGKWQRSEHPDLSGELQDVYNLDWFSLSRCIGKYGARMYDAQVGRWWASDPLAEKYYSFTLYNYVANSPMVLVDPNGMFIRVWYLHTISINTIFGKKSFNVKMFWDFNGKNEKKSPNNIFVQDFLKAYNYNIKNGGGENLKTAAFSNDKFELIQSNKKSENYHTDDFRNIIAWNNEMGLKTTSGHILSPATILEHEFDHAVDYNNNSVDNLNRAIIKDPNYDTREEKRVITTTEQKQAQLNKEIKPGEHTRKDHNGEHVRVKDATSNIPRIY